MHTFETTDIKQARRSVLLSSMVEALRSGWVK